MAQIKSQQFCASIVPMPFLPSIDWVELFKQSRLNETHVQSLDTLYHNCYSPALQVFEQLDF